MSKNNFNASSPKSALRAHVAPDLPSFAQPNPGVTRLPDKPSIPCFLRSGTLPRTGLKVISSPELSSSSVSPGTSSISSRSGFGNTIRPVLSSVSLVFILVSYHGNYQWQMANTNSNTLGFWSVTVRANYRIVFCFQDGDACSTDLASR